MRYTLSPALAREIDEATMPTLHRLFFAVLPPPPACGAIAAQRDALPDLRSGIADERLHVTMALTEDFADVPEAACGAMLAIGAAVRAAPASVALDTLSGWGGPVVLRASGALDGLAALHAELDGAMRGAGLLRAGYRWRPHVTLGYARGARFDRAVPPIAWTAEAFALVHSYVGETRHVVRGRWPLVRRQEELFDR